MTKFVKVLEGCSSTANGYNYEIGEVNVAKKWNPNASGAREMGGFNFSKEDKILRWLLRGDTLYDVEVPIDAEVLEIENETAPHGIFRTNKIIISNPRKLNEELVMDLYLKSDLPDKAYFQCLVFLALKGYADVCQRIILDKVRDKNIDLAINTFSEFFTLKEKDKTPVYKNVEETLKEIKDSNLINICESRDVYEKRFTNDKVINVTGQSGSGKSYYVKEHFIGDNYLIVDTDEIFSEHRYPHSKGINRTLGEMFRDKYDKLPDLCEDFDLIYKDILDYCETFRKTIVIDCAQFHAVKDLSILKGKLIIIRTNINTCYHRCIDRYIQNNPEASEEDISSYKERKKRIFKWYKGSNEFIKRVMDYEV